jgi:hypothetical protein
MTNQGPQALRLILLLLFALTSAVSASAQEPNPGSPPDAPTPNRQTDAQKETPALSEKKSDESKAGQNQGDESKVGKSKLEQETGTINDRIFEVMPNYGTVESNLRLPPMTTGQKYRLAGAGVFDKFTYPFIGTLAVIDQANNSPKSWGQGWGAYGKRYGASFADNGIGTYMTTAVFPTILREDPRYYQISEGRTSHRALYALSRLFVTYTDAGTTRFNYSEIIGNSVAAGFSNVYHAPEDRTVGRNLGTLGMLLMWDGVSNEMKEFWPDIRRKLFHKNSP